MQGRFILGAIVGLAVLGACKRSESGDVVVRRPVKVTVTTVPETLRVTTRTETVQTPIVGAKRETVVVDKPVVTGTKKTPVQVPVVEPK